MIRSSHCLLILLLVPQLASAQTTKRVGWDACRIKGSPEPPARLTVERVFADVKLQKPTEMIRLPGTDRWLVVQLNAKIFSFSTATNRDQYLAVDLRKRQQPWRQTFGIALHPRYPAFPYCYITGTAGPRHPSEGARLSRFTVTDFNRFSIDANSEKVLARWSSNDHMGGSPKFGPDGFLYFGIGDGQRPNPPDPSGTGQDIGDLQSSICRIDVDHEDPGLPYRIPDDNPFVSVPGARGEIWAFGVRNPWRMGFHRTRGELWIGDVGWEMMEMVHKVERGANYGWSVIEGTQPVKPDGVRSQVPVTPPVAEYDHTQGRSITGGYFWHSKRIPELEDTYLYGDYQSGKIWGLKHNGTKAVWNRELVDTRIRIITFAEDNDGEILVVDFNGPIYKFNPNPAASAAPNSAFPKRLSETGLFKDLQSQTPEAGVIEYSINAGHWADNTTSRQWFGIPGDGKMGINTRSYFDDGTVKGYFNYPEGMVFAKTVSYANDISKPASRRRIETQVLHKLDQDWRAYNYIWNDDQTDAILQPNKAAYSTLRIRDPREPHGFRTQRWLHASRDQCMLCHIWRGGSINGFRVEQLNRAHVGESINQLDKLESMAYVEVKLQRPEPAVSPYDETASLNDRARRYLDLNCAHCHMRGGGGSAQFLLMHSATEDEMEVFGQPAMQGNFGLTNAKVIDRGHPSRSVLLYRLAKSGPGRMPKFGNELIDQRGLQLLRDWIARMEPEADAATKSVATLISAAQTDTTIKPDTIKGIDELLASSETGLMLSIGCGELLQDNPLRKAILKQALSARPAVRDLFERFFDATQRTERLDDTVTVDQLVALKGNANRGRRLFFESSLSCRNCHQIKGKGRMVGPDLTDIAKHRSVEQIVRSLLYPSESIEPKFRSYLVITLTGKIISGFKTNETDNELTLVDGNGKKFTLSQDEIDEVQPQSKSLMPEGLLQPLTESQAADLLAFLRTLK